MIVDASPNHINSDSPYSSTPTNNQQLQLKFVQTVLNDSQKRNRVLPTYSKQQVDEALQANSVDFTFDDCCFIARLPQLILIGYGAKLIIFDSKLNLVLKCTFQVEMFAKNRGFMYHGDFIFCNAQTHEIQQLNFATLNVSKYQKFFDLTDVKRITLIKGQLLLLTVQGDLFIHSTQILGGLKKLFIDVATIYGNDDMCIIGDLDDNIYVLDVITCQRRQLHQRQTYFCSESTLEVVDDDKEYHIAFTKNFLQLPGFAENSQILLVGGYSVRKEVEEIYVQSTLNSWSANDFKIADMDIVISDVLKLDEKKFQSYCRDLSLIQDSCSLIILDIIRHKRHVDIK